MTTGPAPYYQDELVRLYLGDCLDILPTLPDNSVDAVCTDPPYGLEFMGKEWDSPRMLGASQMSPIKGFGRYAPGEKRTGYANNDSYAFQQWCEQWAAECLRILRPGGHLLAFGGTRTSHRLACAVEDAGFEIRDSIAWLYGSGFPKSLDVSKAIDRAAGAERVVVGPLQSVPDHNLPGTGARFRNVEELDGARLMVPTDTAPATPEAEQWQGWGTALKPAHEPIIVARKPLTGTVAANVLRWGTGALNIDSCRIEGEPVAAHRQTEGPKVALGTGWGEGYQIGDAAATPPNTAGRWPANVALDESQAAELDQMSGESVSAGGSRGAGGQHGMYEPIGAQPDFEPGYGDSGGASRFFYTAKASSDERISYWRPSCNCETVKPCGETSQPRATGDLRSAPDKSWSTSTSGSSTTDGRSHPDTTFTTETATSSTTTPATSNSSPSSTTSASTPAASFATGNGGSPAGSATNSNPSPSPTGISVPKDGRFTAVAAPATLRGWSETSRCESCGAPAKREQHATVKPLSLMRWLVRLVTPPGGVILEPFAGSGATVEAALLEGFRCIAIEREADYLPLITQRINRRRDPIAYLTAAGEDLGLFAEADA